MKKIPCLRRKCQMLKACLQFPLLLIRILCCLDSLTGMCTLVTWCLKGLLASSFIADALGSFGSNQVLIPFIICPLSYSSATILVYYRSGQTGREHEVTESWKIRHLKANCAYHQVLHISPYLHIIYYY